MGFKFMSWAVDQKTSNCGQKLVLLLLSNHCNEYTHQCNPSHKKLAEECCMGISTLKRHIDGLAEAGLLTIEHKFVEGFKRPSQYILNVSPIDQKVGIDSPNRAICQPKSGYPIAQIGLKNQEDEPVNELLYINTWDLEVKQPSTKKSKRMAVVAEKPSGLADIVWEEWVKHRAKKSAAISEFVIRKLIRDGATIGWTLEQVMEKMIVSNWQGFDPSWINKSVAVEDESWRWKK